MNLAFIASTLPAWFLKKNIKTLKIDMFIFLNEDIFKIYDSFLTLNNKFYLFNETIKNEENRKKIYNFENTFLIFHECCWDKLDKIIINDKIETTFYPISSLKGWVDLDKSGLFNIFVR